MACGGRDSSYVMGVDVGGTNTDVVLLKDGRVVSLCKSPTTPDPLQGIVDAITGCLSKCDPASVKANLSRVCIGTTHFINAIVERNKDCLTPVAVVRLCGPASLAVPPFADFPKDLKSLLMGRVFCVSGGQEYNGVPISNIKQGEIKEIAQKLLSCDPPLKDVVVSGIFSVMDNPEKNQETDVSDILSDFSKDFSITQASQVRSSML